MPLNRGCTYEERIDARASGSTVLAHLLHSRTHSTESDWTSRITRGEVELDGKPAVPDAILKPGQRLVWHRPAWLEPEVPRHFAIIHQDEHLLAVIKPAGLPTMPGGGFLVGTLLTLVRESWPEASPLHRLGRETSGIVLFARTHEAAAHLAKSWREHAVEKRYVAVGSGSPEWDALDVNARIGPVSHPTLGSVHAASDAGKPAHSRVVVDLRGHHSTRFLVDITTGRPHQIRIHLAFAGHPLVGDPLYAPGGIPRAQPGLPGDGGYFLHAQRLAFIHPATNGRLVLEAPAPDTFADSRVL